MSAKPNDGQLNDVDSMLSMGVFQAALESQTDPNYPAEPTWPALIVADSSETVHYAKVNPAAWAFLEHDNPLNRRRVYLECLLGDASRLMEQLDDHGFDVSRVSHQALLYGVGPHAECVPGSVQSSLLDCIPQRFSCILSASSGRLLRWLQQPSDWLYIAVDMSEYARLNYKTASGS